jgi:branched-chain amino acid transport system permease protein
MFDLDPVESRILYGACLIAVIMLLPNGLIAGAMGAGRRVFARRAPTPRSTSPDRIPASGS